MIIETVNSAYEIDTTGKLYRRACRLEKYSSPDSDRAETQRFGDWEGWKPYVSLSIIMGHLYIYRQDKKNPLVTSRITQFPANDVPIV